MQGAGGRLNRALNDSSQWGFTLGNAVRVWRIGVGIDRRGNLIYVAANDLITYDHQGGLDPSKVVPDVMQPARRYLVPDDRDFFAVYQRLPGPVSVPFRWAAR